MTELYPVEKYELDKLKKCPACKGMGVVWTEWGYERCEECNGEGRVEKEKDDE